MSRDWPQAPIHENTIRKPGVWRYVPTIILLKGGRLSTTQWTNQISDHAISQILFYYIVFADRIIPLNLSTLGMVLLIWSTGSTSGFQSGIDFAPEHRPSKRGCMDQTLGDKWSPMIISSVGTAFHIGDFLGSFLRDRLSPLHCSWIHNSSPQHHMKKHFLRSAEHCQRLMGRHWLFSTRCLNDSKSSTRLLVCRADIKDAMRVQIEAWVPSEMAVIRLDPPCCYFCHRILIMVASVLLYYVILTLLSCLSSYSGVIIGAPYQIPVGWACYLMGPILR